MVDKNSKESIQAAGNILVNTELKSCNSIIDSGYMGSLGFIPKVKCGVGFDAKVAASAAHVGAYYHDGTGKAIGRITNNEYHSKCTPSVAWFIGEGLKAGGSEGWKFNPQGKCGYGWEMRTILPNYGFERVAKTDEVCTKEKMDKWSREHAVAGDVCVMTHGGIRNPINGKYRHDKLCGHACIFNGQYWVSDAVQVNAGALVYGNVEYYGVEVYRHKNCKKEEEKEETNTEIKVTNNTSSNDAINEDDGKCDRKINIAFIGDGFSQKHNGCLPETVRKDLKINSNYFKCYAQNNVMAEDYYSVFSHITSHNGAVYTSLKKKPNKPKDAFNIMEEYFKGVKEQCYCFVALGYNEKTDSARINVLLQEIRGWNKNMKVIMVKMFRYKKFDAKRINSLYHNLSNYTYTIDLTDKQISDINNSEELVKMGYAIASAIKKYIK